MVIYVKQTYNLDTESLLQFSRRGCFIKSGHLHTEVDRAQNTPLKERISFFSMAQQRTFIEEQKLVAEVEHLCLILQISTYN